MISATNFTKSETPTSTISNEPFTIPPSLITTDDKAMTCRGMLIANFGQAIYYTSIVDVSGFRKDGRSECKAVSNDRPSKDLVKIPNYPIVSDKLEDFMIALDIIYPLQKRSHKKQLRNIYIKYAIIQKRKFAVTNRAMKKFALAFPEEYANLTLEAESL
jgi:hypothetical protein